MLQRAAAVCDRSNESTWEGMPSHRASAFPCFHRSLYSIKQEDVGLASFLDMIDNSQSEDSRQYAVGCYSQLERLYGELWGSHGDIVPAVP